MTTLRDRAGAVRRYLLGEASYSPRLENVAKRVLDNWVLQVEQGRTANRQRKAEGDARALEIRRAVDAEVERDGITRTMARKRVAKIRASAFLPIHSFATVRNADKHAGKLIRTGTAALKE
jgi:hypothetical protein